MNIDQNAYDALQSLLGAENISVDPAVLMGYRFSGITFIESLVDRSAAFDPFGGPKPIAVVLPSCAEEVQEIVRICNRYRIHCKAQSTGYGGHAMPGVENVVMVDLRKMNRIVEIDEKNLYAVIEPYVTAHQLQSEVMKRGMNCHVITAGGNHSPLASATSFQGQGPTGFTTSCNQRNLLGAEWVSPTGDLHRIGSPGSDAGWSCGDGPGPDFRGLLRGFTGAAGGLGIFTRIGYKLYPWPAKEKLKKTGKLPVVGVETPENYKFHFAYWESWDEMTEAAYHIMESEVAYSTVRIPQDWWGWFLTPTNNEFYRRFQDGTLPITREHGMHWATLIAGRTKTDFEYKNKVFQKIVADTNGKLLELPAEDEAVLLLQMISPMYTQRLMRAKKSALGMGGPTLAQMESMSLLKKLYETDIDCMKEYVKPGGALMAAGPDGTWAWPSEPRKLWTESVHFLDETPESLAGATEYAGKVLGSIMKDRGSLAFDQRLMIGGVNDIFGPQLGNVQDWMRKIKNAFDPRNVSDHSTYISPEPPPPMPMPPVPEFK
ncbi:MAG: FAD-binding oxidoreductase [Desulfuromonadaceae bacterium]|nr:FAD-binding oxidoreductase [Desulfuromonadaceae bacterium]